MHGPVEDPLIERVADALRRPAPLRPDFDARVMAAVRMAAPASGGAARGWEWLREPRTLALSPLGGLAIAAGFAAVVFLGTGGVVRAPGGAAAVRGAPSVSVVT